MATAGNGNGKSARTHQGDLRENPLILCIELQLIVIPIPIPWPNRNIYIYFFLTTG